MSDRAVIAGGGQTDDGWILHGDRQEPRKTPFHRASLIVDRLEVLRAVIDGIPNAGRKTEKIVAPLLVHELVMPGGT